MADPIDDRVLGVFKKVFVWRKEPMAELTDTEKIRRLEFVMGQLISWLVRELGENNATQLLKVLTDESDMWKQ